jgi:hypothetical protein
VLCFSVLNADVIVIAKLKCFLIFCILFFTKFVSIKTVSSPHCRPIIHTKHQLFFSFYLPNLPHKITAKTATVLTLIGILYSSPIVRIPSGGFVFSLKLLQFLLLFFLLNCLKTPFIITVSNIFCILATFFNDFIVIFYQQSQKVTNYQP